MEFRERNKIEVNALNVSRYGTFMVEKSQRVNKMEEKSNINAPFNTDHKNSISHKLFQFEMHQCM